MYRGRYDFFEPVYGEIYFNDNTDTLTISITPPVQIVSFDTNGFSNKTTPDHTQNHILIKEYGIYEVEFNCHLSNGEATAQTVDITMYANNGTVEFINVHSHRKLSGGQGDIGSMSGGGFCELFVGETVELWVTGSVDSKDIVIDDISLRVIKVI